MTKFTMIRKKENGDNDETKEKAPGGKIRKKFRRNRIMITAFAVMIAVAGYLNYADRIGSTMSGEETDLEAANAAADAVYEGDSQLNSEEDIASLDVDYDLVLSEDDLLEEVTETETAGDKDGTPVGESDETETGETDETGTDTENASDGTDASDADDGVDGTDVASSGVGETLFVSSTGVLTFVAEAKLSREQARAKHKETLLEIVQNDALSESAKQSAISEIVELSDVIEMETAAETLLAAKGFTNAVVTIQDESVDVIVNAEQLSDSERARIEDIITQKTGISVENITIVPLRESEE